MWYGIVATARGILYSAVRLTLILAWLVDVVAAAVRGQTIRSSSPNLYINSHWDVVPRLSESNAHWRFGRYSGSPSTTFFDSILVALLSLTSPNWRRCFNRLPSIYDTSSSSAFLPSSHCVAHTAILFVGNTLRVVTCRFGSYRATSSAAARG